MSAGLAVATGQRAAAGVLVDLLDRGLPLVTWQLSGVRLGELTGQVGTYTGPLAYRLSALTDYARMLGAPATLHLYQGTADGALHVQGTLNGVPVDVWTAMDADELAMLDGPQFAAMLGECWTCRGCPAAMFTLSSGLPGAVPAVCAECAPYACLRGKGGVR